MAIEWCGQALPPVVSNTSASARGTRGILVSIVSMEFLPLKNCTLWRVVVCTPWRVVVGLSAAAYRHSYGSTMTCGSHNQYFDSSTGSVKVFGSETVIS